MGKLQDWLDGYRSERTRESYLQKLGLFLRIPYPDKTISLDEAVEQYLETRTIKEIEQDVLKFWTTLQKYTPKSQQMRLSIVRTFLGDHDKVLGPSFWNRFSRKLRGKAKVQHKDQVPTSEQLRQIFLHLHLNTRALYHIQAAAGTRVGETLQIKLKNLHLDETPPRIFLEADITKSGVGRDVFITPEAKEVVLEWLKTRKQYIAMKPKHLGGGDLDDPRLFPFTHNNAYFMWNKALKKSGLYKKDPITGMQQMRSHTLRKRFRTQMAVAIPVDVVEALMGHEGYETQSYRRYTTEELGEFYLKGQHVLLISTERAELERVANKTREAGSTQIKNW
ncbi:MAG: tyrosine-type recombinase/integrase [Candidatus Thorarchaeota archaeon]